MKRRKFLRNSSLLTLASLATARCKYENNLGQKDFGVQLWTLRYAMREDVRDTFEKIRKIGYTDVENAGYHEGLCYGFSMKNYKQLLNDVGLKMRSGHVPLGWNTPELKKTMAGDFEAVCHDHAELGVKYMVCPWFKNDGGIDKVKRLAELLNKCGEKAKEYNITMAYHNHEFEFKEIDGQLPYDILLNETDPDKVVFQLDLYWIKLGEKEALHYFKNHSGRFELWHVKDMDDSEDKFFAAVGKGIIDWPPIFAKSAQAGMKHFYIEQDHFRKYPPLKSISISHQYVSNLI